MMLTSIFEKPMLAYDMLTSVFYKTDVNAYTLTSIFEKPMLTYDMLTSVFQKTDVNINFFLIIYIF